MTTRTLSALLAAGVILLAGRSVGFFSQVQWLTIGKAFIAGGAWVTALSIAFTAVSFVFATLEARRHSATVRDVSQRVTTILESIDEHNANRREQEAELAELERQHCDEVEKARRAYEARHAAEDDETNGNETDKPQ